MVSELLDSAIFYPNTTSPCACAPLLVQSPGSAKLRFTVDLRTVIRFTTLYQWPMPNFEQKIHNFAGPRCYAMFDLSHGYWQLPLSKWAQASQSFITPDVIYSLARVLHGSTNSVMYLQSTLAFKLPSDLLRQIMYWLDDLLLQADTIYQLPNAIRRIFGFCKEFNFTLHP